MHNIKIISFGSLIKEHGGNLTTGLALVMWKLAYHINNKNGFKVAFAATDFYQERKEIEGIEVLGWTKTCLLKYMYKHKLIIVKYLIKAFYIFVFYRLKFIRTFIYLIFFDKTVRESESDLFHVHGTNYIYFHYLDRKIYGKTVITIHGMNGIDPNIKNYRYQKKIEQLITSLNFFKVIFITTDLKSQWIQEYGNPLSEVSVILDAYDKIYFFPEQNLDEKFTKTILTSVGRVYPLKGQERVIYALSKLPKEKNFEYWIIGSGEEKYINKLNNIAKSSNIDVKFLGDLNPNKVAEKLQQTSYMILPSSSEGLGIAYLESIACGTKVIIPCHLPLSKEKGILNTNNAIFLRDSSVEAIIECLNELPILSSYNKMEVSQSVTHLNWENISEEYCQLIKNVS